MAPTPVFGERALRTEAGGVVSLVVGDLHVGLERDLHRSGVHLPSQTEGMRERLLELVDRVDAQRLVVLGDLKDSVGNPSRQEERELPTFFRGLDVEVHVVPGNHDAGLADVLPDAVFHGSEGTTLGGDALGLVHGHTWPADDVMACEVVAVCHNHPMVMLRDELGHRHKEPCWVRAGFTPAARERYPELPEDAELVVVPAFNPLLGGTAVNRVEGTRLIGPLFQNGLVDVDTARVWTLDGVDLGTVEALRRFGDAPVPTEEAPEEGAGDG